MLTLTMIVLVAALGAPGEIYRCQNASGAVSFQDKPCAGAASASRISAGNDSAASQLALQQWLDAYRQRAPSASRSTAPARTYQRAGVGSVGGAVSEAQLAMCSERFLHCARGDGAAMDRCVDALPRCGASGAAPCCPQACVSRYQGLRADGQPMANAVRLALLDPAAPACGVAGSR